MFYRNIRFTGPERLPPYGLRAPECHRPQFVGEFIHDELQHVGAVRNLLAGFRGFEHSHLNVRDVRCLQSRHRTAGRLPR